MDDSNVPETVWEKTPYGMKPHARCKRCGKEFRNLHRCALLVEGETVTVYSPVLEPQDPHVREDGRSWPLKQD